jgi:hypothetical protein
MGLVSVVMEEVSKYTLVHCEGVVCLIYCDWSDNYDLIEKIVIYVFIIKNVP